jgi:hypothetical protein
MLGMANGLIIPISRSGVDAAVVSVIPDHLDASAVGRWTGTGYCGAGTDVINLDLSRCARRGKLRVARCCIGAETDVGNAAAQIAACGSAEA